ncbi:MAG: TolC family protein [Saprospiraceae bacterium]
MRQYEYWIFFSIGILFSLSLQGQSSLPVGQVLSSARHDRTVDLQQQHIDFISGTNQNIPFVDQISLRSETERFQVFRQQYLARLTVNGFGEMHQQHKLNQASMMTETQVRKVYEHEALNQRYEAAVLYRFILQRMALQEELILVYQDKVDVLKKLTALSTGVEVDDLIKTEYDRDGLNLDMEEARTQLDIIKGKIATWVLVPDTDWNLDTSGFIDPAHMELVVDQIPSQADHNPSIIEKQYKLDQVQAEYNVEKASASQMLDFFQVQYARRTDGLLNREFSAGIGINLPFKGSSRVKIANLQINRNNLEQNIQLNLEQFNQSVKTAHEQMTSLIRRYNLAKEQWNQSQNKFTLDHSSLVRADGPMTLLKAREMQIKRQLTLLDLGKQIVDQYIIILDLTGVLSSVPSVNYLSKHLENY